MKPNGKSRIRGEGIDQDCSGVDRIEGKAFDGGTFSEICDNGVDDNGEGKTDCADEEGCRQDPSCLQHVEVISLGGIQGTGMMASILMEGGALVG